MKKNTLAKQLIRFGLMIALFPAFMSSCLMEYPEELENGEVGIDPTFVTVNTKVTINLNSTPSGDVELKSHAQEEEKGDDPVYKYRIIVAAFEGREMRAQKIIYEDQPLTNRLQTEVDLELHARKYNLVTWVDYYCEEEGPIYEINTVDGLLGIKGYDDKYLGNSDYKRTYYSSDELDLTEYKYKWGSEVPVDVRASSPMARYELVATDLQKFLSSYPDVKNIQLTLMYNSYVPTGFNALDGITKHAFRYQSFSRTIKRPEEAEPMYPLVFDYVFTDVAKEAAGSAAPISVTLLVEDVTNPTRKVEIASSTFNILLECGDNKKIAFDFLTTKEGDGVGFDTEFEGNNEVDVPVE